jgi:hypothetical protein
MSSSLRRYIWRYRREDPLDGDGMSLFAQLDESRDKGGKEVGFL